MKQKRLTGLALIALTLGLLCGCQKTVTDEERFHKLIDVFTEAGYPCALQDLPDDTPVGIYNASVWKALNVNGQTVLVYFDESNRADYLFSMIDQETYGYATYWGQRFVLNYSGTDEALLTFLKTL